MEKRAGLTPSLEDYLEVIYQIIEEKKAARVKEIARRLGVNNSSVTGALKSLSAKGFLNYSPYDVITLTETGERIALDVIRRHEVLKKFFTDVLCIDSGEADEAACRMEHAVTSGVLEKIVRFVEFTEICPRSGPEWIEGFRKFCSNGLPKACCTHWQNCTLSFKNPESVCPVFSAESRPLSRVGKGQRVRLVNFEKANGAIARLMDLGIDSGSVFEVENVHPDTEDMAVYVRGYRFTLRKESADRIMVAAC